MIIDNDSASSAAQAIELESLSLDWKWIYCESQECFQLTLFYRVQEDSKEIELGFAAEWFALLNHDSSVIFIADNLIFSYPVIVFFSNFLFVNPNGSLDKLNWILTKWSI